MAVIFLLPIELARRLTCIGNSDIVKHELIKHNATQTGLLVCGARICAPQFAGNLACGRRTIDRGILCGPNSSHCNLFDARIVYSGKRPGDWSPIRILDEC